MADELVQLWGRNIAQFRKDRGLSPIEFAEAVSVSPATVSRWEAGLMAPTAARKLDIAEVLGVDTSTLFPLVRVA